MKPTAIQSTSNNSQHMNINEASVNSNMNLIGHLVPEVSDSLNENSINIPDPEVSDNLSVNSANIPVPGVSDNLSIISKSVPEAKSGKNSIACRFHLANKCIKKSDCTFVHPCMSFLTTGHCNDNYCSLSHSKPCHKFQSGLCFETKCMLLHLKNRDYRAIARRSKIFNSKIVTSSQSTQKRSPLHSINKISSSAHTLPFLSQIHPAHSKNFHLYHPEKKLHIPSKIPSLLTLQLTPPKLNPLKIPPSYFPPLFSRLRPMRLIPRAHPTRVTQV